MGRETGAPGPRTLQRAVITSFGPLTTANVCANLQRSMAGHGGAGHSRALGLPVVQKLTGFGSCETFKVPAAGKKEHKQRAYWENCSLLRLFNVQVPSVLPTVYTKDVSPGIPSSHAAGPGGSWVVAAVRTRGSLIRSAGRVHAPSFSRVTLAARAGGRRAGRTEPARQRVERCHKGLSGADGGQGAENYTH